MKKLFLILPSGMRDMVKSSFVTVFTEDGISYLDVLQQNRRVADPAEFQRQLLKNMNSREFFQEEVDTAPIHPRIKAICFYLPQFYSFAENDQWWGKGFTEWTNVTKALPQFAGHFQPRLPMDLGFYDLRQVETHVAQVKLARKYGIHGFCYYYYWFDGKRLLDKPLDLVLQNPQLDFPFCICWANENWSRRWDGDDKQILIGQSYPPGYEDQLFNDLIPILSDPRYIRIDGKLAIIVYRPSDLPSAKVLAEKWRAAGHASGLGELFILSTHSFDTTDPRTIGFDATIEFAPNNSKIDPITPTVDFFNREFRGNIYNYQSLLHLARSYKTPDFLKFRGVCPSWDNEARKPGRGNVFANSNPQLYGEWLNEICEFTDRNMPPEQKVVFINAWNEWAEGAYLEPDRYFGHAYLLKTYQILEKFKK